MCLSVSYVKYAIFLLNLTPIKTLRDRKKNFHKKKRDAKKKIMHFFLLKKKKIPIETLRDTWRKWAFAPI